jgi:hypothetical protein
MADSSLMPAIFGLLGSVIGSATILIGQYVQDRRKQTAEDRKAKKDKLEELNCELYAHEHWVAAMANNSELAKDDLVTIIGKLPPPPISKMLSISNVNFPDLQDPIQEFSKIAAAHVKSVVHKGQSNFARSNDLFRQHNEAVKRLEQLIRDYARREFQ